MSIINLILYDLMLYSRISTNGLCNKLIFDQIFVRQPYGWRQRNPAFVGLEDRNSAHALECCFVAWWGVCFGKSVHGMQSYNYNIFWRLKYSLSCVTYQIFVCRNRVYLFGLLIKWLLLKISIPGHWYLSSVSYRHLRRKWRATLPYLL